MIIPTSSTVSYFPYDASFSEYSSRLSVKLLSRSHRLRPLTISCLRYSYVASGIIRRATLIYKSFHKENKMKYPYLRSNALYANLRDKFGLCLAGGGGEVVKRFSANFIFVHTTIKADSHTACLVHAAPMPFPCHSVPLRV
jgi:hypothetical protein